MSQEIIGRYNTLSEKHKKLKSEVLIKFMSWEIELYNINELIPPDNKEITNKIKTLENEMLYLKGVIQDL